MSERFTEATPESTPETPDAVSGMIEVPEWSFEPNSAEVHTSEQPKFDDIGDRILAHNELSDAAEQLETMRGFVRTLLDDVEAGGIKNSAGEAYTPDAMRQQLIGFIDGMDNPVNEHGEKTNPLMHIPGAEGLRKMFLKFANNESTYAALRQAIVELKIDRLNVQGQERKNATAESLHVTAARDLGEVAVSEALKEKMSPEQAAFESLPENVQNEINDLRRAQKDHREEERNRDYSAAARAKERVTEISRDLSPKAKKFLEEQYGW